MGEQLINPDKVTPTKLKKEYPFFHVLGLKPREIRFVYYYCTSMNQTQAIKQAGYKGKTDGVLCAKANQLLKRVKVRDAIRQFFDIVLDIYKDKLEKEIFDILYRQMSYDPFMFIKKDGAPAFKREEDIPKEWRCCIKGIKTKLYGVGKDYEERITEIELVDRQIALDKLAKYITMFSDISVNHTMSEETRRKLSLIFTPIKGKVVEFPKPQKAG